MLTRTIASGLSALLTVSLASALPPTTERSELAAPAEPTTERRQLAQLSNRCEQTAIVKLRIGSTVLFLPRNVISLVVNQSGQAIDSWKCQSTEVDARAVSINITRRNGKEFSEDWISRLPREIRIYEHGGIIKPTGSQFEDLKKQGQTVVRSATGFDVIRLKSAELYDASALGATAPDGGRLVFHCFPSVPIKTTSSRCQVSYQLNDGLGVSYAFLTQNHSEAAWIRLDDQFRAFMRQVAK